MAVIGNFKGKLISYEQDTADSILEKLKVMLPDQGNFDENLADYAGLLAAFALQGKGEKLELVANGFSLYIDTVTNQMNSAGSIDETGLDGVFSFFRSLFGALSGTVAGIVVGSAIKSPVLAFAFGNTVETFALDIWDDFIGPSYKVFHDIEFGKDYVKMFKSDGTLKNTLDPNWHDSMKEATKYFNKNAIDNIIFNFSDAKFYYNAKEKNVTLDSGMTTANVKNVLKILSEDFLPSINGEQLIFNALHDFYNDNGISKNELISGFKSGDKQIQYALLYLVPYILGSDENFKVFNSGNSFDAHLYSDEYIKDRADFYYQVIEENDECVFYYDQKMNIGIGQTNADAPGNYSRVVFVDTNYDYSPVYGKTYSQLTFYGNDKNNHITAESRADNYVEGGLGSDTIITGMGNDTIYTNANIDTKYDNEDNNTINTVIAGQGSDTIYGSKGKDIVYGDDQENEGNNWSFTDDDDIIKTYGGDDRVYGGNDSDIIEGGSGNDTLYGGDDDDEIYAYYKQNSTDKEGTDENTINVLYGEDEDDTLDSGLGSDLLYSSSCNDIIYATGTIYNKTLQIYQNYK